MTKSSKANFCKIAFGVAVIAMLMAVPLAHGQVPDLVPQGPLSKQSISRPPLRSARPGQLMPSPTPPPIGGSWQRITAPVSGLSNPLLLTDGTVILHQFVSSTWYKLTPDAFGSYVNGTLSQIASLPSGYGPWAFASAVLPDGRVIVEGGEYNLTASSGNQVWTSLGAIYDPIADTWTPVAPPNGPGWVNTAAGGCNGGIGDAPSIVLPNGTFMLGAACASPPVVALFDPTTLGWSTTGAPVSQNESGYTLMQNGKVLMVLARDPPNVQQYDPATGAWSFIGPTPVPLPDPSACRSNEIGPAVTRPDGTVVAFGGNTGCTSSPADPTAIYTPSSNTWVQGPNVPAVCGTSNPPTLSCTLADAGAALLPNGNILFVASAGLFNPPGHFFEFTTANAINQVADDYVTARSGAYNFLVLPNGQILATTLSSSVEFYTPAGTPDSAWAPAVTSVASCVSPGSSYVLNGTQLNGLSQGAAYGDDAQGATNYPLVQIVNNGTGHVFYARTSGHSTMSIAPGQPGSTNFLVSAATEIGASTLYVVANGIPSAGTAVYVRSSCLGVLQVSPAANIVAAGNPGGPFGPPSFQYQLAATTGSINYSISGYPSWLTPSSTSGSASPSGTTVIFTVNANANSLAVGTYGPTTITFANSDTGQGTQTRTATLTVNPPALLVGPTAGVATSGTHGGPFSPFLFHYALSATYGSVKYSITTPSWLTASSKSGTVTTSAHTIVFAVNSSAHSLPPNTYVNSINFQNTSNNQGNTTRVATLVVDPKDYRVTVRASPTADGTVSGGGTFTEGSSSTVTATPNGAHSFIHWTENGRVVSTSPNYTFTMPKSNITLVADFQ